MFDIADLLARNGDDTDRKSVLKILQEHGFETLSDVKEELLDLVIWYMNLALRDTQLTECEKRDVRNLKHLFGIEEGDFRKFRPDEIGEVIQGQLQCIYRDDDKIDADEALLKVGLQGLFDLSYDEFLEYANVEDLKAIERGASLLELDTVFRAPPQRDYVLVAGREISQDVKDAVWRRDGGRCVNCGSHENLEFDHIVPFSKGGSNTYRNIQLLCEGCNRSKGNTLG